MGRWVHVAASLSSERIDLYLDAKLVASSSADLHTPTFTSSSDLSESSLLATLAERRGGAVRGVGSGGSGSASGSGSSGGGGGAMRGSGPKVPHPSSRRPQPTTPLTLGRYPDGSYPAMGVNVSKMFVLNGALPPVPGPREIAEVLPSSPGYSATTRNPLPQPQVNPFVAALAHATATFVDTLPPPAAAAAGGGGGAAAQPQLQQQLQQLQQQQKLQLEQALEEANLKFLSSQQQQERKKMPSLRAFFPLTHPLPSSTSSLADLLASSLDAEKRAAHLHSSSSSSSSSSYSSDSSGGGGGGLWGSAGYGGGGGGGGGGKKGAVPLPHARFNLGPGASGSGETVILGASAKAESESLGRESAALVHYKHTTNTPRHTS